MERSELQRKYDLKQFQLEKEYLLREIKRERLESPSKMEKKFRFAHHSEQTVLRKQKQIQVGDFEAKS